MDGVVVIGEGEKDEAPMLYNGEQIGDGSLPHVDIAVDPLEGTRLTALGMPNAVAVDRAQRARDHVRPRARACTWRSSRAARTSPTCSTSTVPLGETVRRVAERRGMDIRDVMVVTLDRPRHEEGIEGDPRRRRARAAHHRRRRRRLAAGGERPLAGQPAVGHRRHARGRDLLGGDQVHRRRLRRAPLAARRRRAQGRARRRATTSSKQFTKDDLVKGDDCFFSATGVTDGDVLQGVRYLGRTATTESIVMRSRSGTVRRVRAEHNRAKLREITGERYG